MNQYTKQGDTGFSSTMNRMMIEKSSPVFHLLGTLEEFTGALGMARPWLPAQPPQLLDIVRQVQDDTAALSGEIAGGPGFATRERVANLEKAIESLSGMLPQPIGEAPEAVPGASRAGAALDLARAIARRAEREAVALSQRRGLSRDILAWLNRISDLVYAMARLADQLSGQSERAAASNSASASQTLSVPGIQPVQFPRSSPTAPAAPALPPRLWSSAPRFWPRPGKWAFGLRQRSATAAAFPSVPFGTTAHCWPALTLPPTKRLPAFP